MLATLALMTVVGGSDGWAVSERVVPPHLEAMTHQEQAASSKQELPLTPESVAEALRFLARERMHVIPLVRRSESLEVLSKELIRLNQASEDTIKGVGALLGRNEDSPKDGELVISRLLFLLRYRPPPELNGYSRDIFFEYHEHLLVPPLDHDEFEDRDAYKDYPTPEQYGEGKWLTLDRRDYYDWPWRLTKDGWQIRLFTYRLGSDMQDYDSMYEVFSKLPLRKGVNVERPVSERVERELPPHLQALTHQKQAASSKQEFPLTPEGVASTINRLAEEFEKRRLNSRDPAYRKRLSEELVRLNRASEETVRKLDGLWSTGYDEPILAKMIITRLWFLLRYRPPTPDGGFTDMEFTSFHGYIFVSRLEAGEDQDFPTLSSPGYDSLAPSERYDWPWELTKDGWQLRWFAVHGGGSEGYAGIYERFNKYPLRKGVNDKKALRGNPGLVHALRREREEVSPRARARVGLLGFWGE